MRRLSIREMKAHWSEVERQVALGGRSAEEIVRADREGRW
jgi:hypothetical protein